MTQEHDASPQPVVHLLDDDASMLRALSRLLTAAGYTVRAYASASEFLARTDHETRGCVITDLRMPEVDGLQMQSSLARAANPLPVIFLTGHGDVPTSVHAMRAGAEDFLTKPVQRPALLAAVERALARDAADAAVRRRHADLRSRWLTLTPREREVLQHILTGQLNKQIAADLGTTERTIKAHRGSIMAKMRVRSPAELGRVAHEAGLLGAS
ncbi:MAG: response regulator transcription factor [Opitutaceae bacterium]|nr:response regulator transcription factor [Opitutaceae bacterium]